MNAFAGQPLRVMTVKGEPETPVSWYRAARKRVIAYKRAIVNRAIVNRFIAIDFASVDSRRCVRDWASPWEAATRR